MAIPPNATAGRRQAKYRNMMAGNDLRFTPSVQSDLYTLALSTFGRRDRLGLGQGLGCRNQKRCSTGDGCSEDPVKIQGLGIDAVQLRSKFRTKRVYTLAVKGSVRLGAQGVSLGCRNQER